MNLNDCGFFCFPASLPGDGRAPWKCAHPKTSHYCIDGEAIGCSDCERAEMRLLPDDTASRLLVALKDAHDALRFSVGYEPLRADLNELYNEVATLPKGWRVVEAGQ